MKKTSFLLFVPILLINICCTTMAKNEKLSPKKQLTQYHNVSVNFTSMGAGINQEAYDELSAYVNQVQKKFKDKLQSENMNWGREGERLLYFQLSQLPGAEGREFYHTLKKMFRDKNKMAVVQPNLYYEPNSHQLIFNAPLLGQNQYREEALLDYIAAFEKTNAVKINTGHTTKETSTGESQDENPYLLDLTKLSAAKQSEVIENIKLLMKAGNFQHLTIDFKSAGAAPELKEGLRKFMQEFEKNYNLKLDYTITMNEPSGFSEQFTFNLQSLNENTKGAFISRLKKMFTDNKEQATIKIH